MAIEIEAQETEVLLHTEEPPAGRLTRWPRLATVLSATALLALGGKVAWHGMRVSEQDIIGASGACTDNGENCMDSRCCKEEGSTCFKKNEHWAICNTTCSPKMLWSNGVGWIEQAEDMWDCLALLPEDEDEDESPTIEASAAGTTEAPAAGTTEAGATSSVVNGTNGANGACTDNGEACFDSLCCNDGNSKCFRKNAHWSSCNETCDNNMLWVDDGWARQDEKVWDCHQLSPAQDGEDCTFSRMCADPGSHCYRKSEHWASCNKTCEPNKLWENGQWTQKEEKHWDCHILSAAEDGENCMESKTCKNPNSHCYKKNDHWASCNASCTENYLWVEDKWTEQQDPVWDCTILSCVADGTNCMDSRCCKDEGSTCFKKDEHWASCNSTCSPKMVWANGWFEQAEDVWDCSALLPEDEDEDESPTTEAPAAGTTEAGATEAGTTEAGATEAATTEEAAATTDAPAAGTTEAGATEAGTTEAGATEAATTEEAAATTDAPETSTTRQQRRRRRRRRRFL